jgi:hypothetical protein
MKERPVSYPSQMSLRENLIERRGKNKRESREREREESSLSLASPMAFQGGGFGSVCVSSLLSTGS